MRRNWFRDYVVGYLAIVVVILIWQLVVETGLLKFQFLPAPTQVIVGFFQATSTGQMGMSVGHTLLAVLIGWAIAAVVGVVLGLILGMVRPVWKYSMASFEVVRSLPIIALVPLAVLLFGFTTTTEVVIGSYAAMWPIMLNTQAGVRSLGNDLESVGKVLKMGRWEQIWKMRLPASIPFIVVGLRLGLSTCLVLTLVAEMIGSPYGIGYSMINAENTLQPGPMFAYLVVTAVLGVLLNVVLQFITRRVFRRQLAAAGEDA